VEELDGISIDYDDDEDDRLHRESQ